MSFGARYGDRYLKILVLVADLELLLQNVFELLWCLSTSGNMPRQREGDFARRIHGDRAVEQVLQDRNAQGYPDFSVWAAAAEIQNRQMATKEPALRSPHQRSGPTIWPCGSGVSEELIAGRRLS